MSSSSSANEQNVLSREHINGAFDRMLNALGGTTFHETYRLEDVLADFVGRPLDLTGIAQARRALDEFLHKQDYSPYIKPACVPISRESYKFIEQLRRYYVSDELRKEIDKGIVFKSATKKRKLQVFRDCAELRSFACTKYRELLAEAARSFEQNPKLTTTDQIHLLKQLDSQLRCDECGLCPGTHRRPGLVVADYIRALSK